MSQSAVNLKRTVAGGVMGNALEWYDFAAYAYMAPVLAPHFFPHDDLWPR